jgi:Uma2 family endonuclease
MAVLSAQEFANLLPDASLLESDEPEMESSLHYWQSLLLVSCLEWLWRDRDDFFIGANLTIYFSHQQLKNRDFRGPDFFLVRNTPRQPRRSWVVWEEDGKYPDLIIELLSESTAEVDRTTKLQLYQDRFRTPEYFWFDPHSLELVGFRLAGSCYQEIPWQQQRLWSESLDLYLGVLDGQLRFFDVNGELVPTPQEAAARSTEAVLIAQKATEAAQRETEAAQRETEAAQKATEAAQREIEAARKATELAQQEVDRLKTKLRELAIDPDGID